ILGQYIWRYLNTVQHRKSPIIVVDAFAGPGRFGDGEPGSPLLICKAIERARNIVKMKCLCADINAAHRRALETNLAEYIGKIAERPLESFETAVSRALEIGKESTLFFYLDPYGLKELKFKTVRQIFERKRTESTEVLINFSFKTFMRMSGNWSF